MTATAAHGLPERYEIVEVIARGGMGEVLRARDEHLGRDVAIKVLRDGDGQEPEPTRRARFEREVRAVAQLSSHAAIVTVYDVGETANGLPFMTMQWLSGGALPVDGSVPREVVLRWLCQAATALDAAHEAGIVHRDVKPSNILIDEHGDARVADFGIAMLQDPAAASLTSTGAVIGTASYMSPEQATGHPVVPNSDQYSLAIIAYEILVGRRPFKRDSAVAELAAHASQPPPAPSSLTPDLDPRVDRVFARALAKEPGERYPTCGAFVEALMAAAPKAAPAPRGDDATVVMRRPVVAPQPAAVWDEQDDLPRGSGRSLGRWAALLAALVLLAVAGIAIATAGNDPSGPAEDKAGATTPTATTKAKSTAPRTTQPTKSPATKAAAPEPAATPASEPDTTPEPTPAPAGERSQAEAIAQHERAFALLQQGQYAAALTEAQAALADLGGVAPYEAFANYNVGAALVGLGRCSEALPYLDRSEQLQGQRAPIDAARAACSGGSTGSGKQGKEHGKGKGD